MFDVCRDTSKIHVYLNPKIFAIIKYSLAKRRKEK